MSVAGALLVGERFAVLERQVDELFLDGQQATVEALRHRMLRGRERERVCGERARRAAEHVARELVEHDDPREAVARPYDSQSLRRASCFVERQETAANLGVERGILLEPALVRLAALGAIAEPETQDLVGTVVGHEAGMLS